jgi:polyhydroxyalkanoate synthase
MDKKQELNANQLTLAINDLIDNIQDTFKKLIYQDGEHLHLAVNDLLEAWLLFTRRAVQDPNKLAHAQLVYWQDYLLLCKDLTQRLTGNTASNQLGVASQNRDAIILAFIEKFSFLISQHIHVVIKSIFTEDDEEESKKIEFYTRQFTEAFAQLKYVKTHSEVLYAKLSAGEAAAE